MVFLRVIIQPTATTLKALLATKDRAKVTDLISFEAHSRRSPLAFCKIGLSSLIVSTEDAPSLPRSAVFGWSGLFAVEVSDRHAAAAAAAAAEVGVRLLSLLPPLSITAREFWGHTQRHRITLSWSVTMFIWALLWRKLRLWIKAILFINWVICLVF